MKPFDVFGSLGARGFLERFWQKEPLLLRGAWPGLGQPITAQQLIELSCDDERLARLVWREGDPERWRQRWGPFRPADFLTLAERDWTLLVQEVDQVVGAVADLIQPFRFFPNWRLDDVMVSYAVAGGGVGPHVDRYDVFLLQGEGRRRWRIGAQATQQEALIEGAELGVLSEFTPDHEWVLEPGDLLYLPPRVAHEGTALEPCVTYSIGLRAPRHRDLLADWLAEAVEELDEEAFYADPNLRPADNPGLLTSQMRGDLLEQVLEVARDEQRLGDWLGRFLTRPRREPPRPGDTTTDWRVALAAGAQLRRSSPAHFAYAAAESGGWVLYVGGESWEVDRDLEELLRFICGPQRLAGAELLRRVEVADAAGLVGELLGEGFLRLEPGPS